MIKKIKKDEIKNIIKDVKDDKIHGLNVTVPFKKSCFTLFRPINSKGYYDSICKYNF